MNSASKLPLLNQESSLKIHFYNNSLAGSNDISWSSEDKGAKKKKKKKDNNKQKHNTELKVIFSSFLFSDTDACFYLFAKMEWKFF